MTEQQDQLDDGVLEIGEFAIRFIRWRAALSPHFTDQPHVEHVTEVGA